MLRNGSNDFGIINHFGSNHSFIDTSSFSPQKKQNGDSKMVLMLNQYVS